MYKSMILQRQSLIVGWKASITGSGNPQQQRWMTKTTTSTTTSTTTRPVVTTLTMERLTHNHNACHGRMITTTTSSSSLSSFPIQPFQRDQRLQLQKRFLSHNNNNNINNVLLRSNNTVRSTMNVNSTQDSLILSRRCIQSESEYLKVVTKTLQTIHDTIDTVFDQQEFITDYEITLSQNVLTMSFPPHGTWVLNQQTPNLQIWWSSPLSGPKRFEYDETDHLWFSTKDGLNLGHALSQEIQHIYPDLDIIELNV